MDTDNQERQRAEITAIQAVYPDWFQECPPPKAWAGAVRLPEFIIRIPHPEDEDLAYIHLYTQFPKTYPSRAYPLFTIQQPIKGVPPDLRMKLDHVVHAEAQRLKGDEMVMPIVEIIQEWMSTNIKRPIQNPHSLATEAERRAVEAERLQRERAEAEARVRADEAAQQASALRQAIDADAERRAAAAQLLQRRPRANTDATEVPSPIAGDTPTESFADLLEIDGIVFDTVKLFHARKDCLGTTYLADPVCDDVRVTLPLELCVVDFEYSYYASTQGKKKLRALEMDLRKLTSLRHPNVQSVYAVKMTISHRDGPSRLALLCEQHPRTTLYDVLADCDSLREERAADYLRQVLLALEAIHKAGQVHRGLSKDCIGLVTRSDAPGQKCVKVSKVSWFVSILALHKSNPIGGGVVSAPEPVIPDAWRHREAVASPLDYTRSRDIHCAGFVLLQMLLGMDVFQRFPSPSEALSYSTVSPFLQQLTLKMLSPSKRHIVTCTTLLAEIEEHAPERPPSSLGTAGSLGTLSHSPMKFAHGSPTTPLNLPARRRRPSSPSASPRDYFMSPGLASSQGAPRHSRIKEEWEQLEPLGRGGFGRVFKARLLLDGGVYAVKKVELKPDRRRNDAKIFREVNALAKLNHRFIVRYYTTWIEEDDADSALASEDSSESGDDMTAAGRPAGRGMWRVPSQRDGNSEEDLFRLDFSDPGSGSMSRSISGNSFPSVVFEHSGGGQDGFFSEEGGEESDDDEDEDEDETGEGEDSVVFAIDLDKDLVDGGSTPALSPSFFSPKPPKRFLYIQMEFVEQQTLKERLEDGLSESDGWKFFHQIVDALVYIASQGIIHRDIKPNNIFIDAKGDCKIGDFGLATSSSPGVDVQETSLSVPDKDNSVNNTADVGTLYYIAPEVKRRGRSHAKADLYSLGIVFFEMNYLMKTDSERRHVLENVRLPAIEFPSDWNPTRHRQRQIIEWLLKHDPDQRPTAFELSQSSLMPARVEDEYFRGALRMMAKQDSPHYQAVLNSLFTQPVQPSRAYNYDHDMVPPEHSLLNGVIINKLAEIFRLHGAVEMEPTLLLPVTKAEDQEKAIFLDKYGDAVMLPDHGLLPMARLAERRAQERIKRYHIGDVYKPRLVSGHPLIFKSAVYDIITKDMSDGPIASIAEVISVTAECLRAFPNLEESCEIRMSHARIRELALSRIPAAAREGALEILAHPKTSTSEKRSLLLSKGLLRSVTDELQVLNETEEDLDGLTAKIERSCPALAPALLPCLDEIRQVQAYLHILGVSMPIVLHPLAIGKGGYFKDGISFEITRRKKRADIFASGGRYDSFLSSLAPPMPASGPPVCATGVQISVDKIAAMLAQYHGASQKSLVKDQRSFGFWSPRRCDVYIVSYQSGYMQDRLELAAMLWHHAISADVMYESSVLDSQENHLESCLREGILFTVYPRPRSVRRDQPAYKVKSVLKGTEYDVSRAELVSWLRNELTEQKRVDLATSGVAQAADAATTMSARDLPASSDVHLLLPGDMKKQRRQTKQMFLDRAYDSAARIKAAAQSGMQVLAVDVPPAVFESLVKSSSWITDDDAWRAIATAFPVGQSAYAQQVRELAARRRADGHAFLLLFAVREERIGLLAL